MKAIPQTPLYANQIPYIPKKIEELLPGDVFLHIGTQGLGEVEVESIENNLVIPVDKTDFHRMWCSIFCVIRNNNIPEIPRSLSEVEAIDPASRLKTIYGFPSTELPYTVFPSTEKTISVMNDHADGGAHVYSIRNCTGFKDGNSQYDNYPQTLQFVQKLEHLGEFSEGIQDEQLAYILLDRTEKLNARFPSDHNKEKVLGLYMFLNTCRARIEDRISRGVMGEHKK